MSWQPKRILRFIEFLPTSTSVARVETDAGEAFLKVLGNPEGPHVLACEWVGTRLAAWLGLDTLEFAQLLVRPQDELPLKNGGAALPGIAFATRFCEGIAWPGDADTLLLLSNPEDITKLVVLDLWIRNCDRYRKTPPRTNRDNVFLAKQRIDTSLRLRLKAMDHSHAFTCGAALSGALGTLDWIEDERIYGCFPEFEQFLRTDLLRSAWDRLREFSEADAESILRELPQEWEVTDPVRASWVRFIVRRARFLSQEGMRLLRQVETIADKLEDSDEE